MYQSRLMKGRDLLPARPFLGKQQVKYYAQILL